MSEVMSAEPKEVVEASKSGKEIVLIDVRTPGEYESLRAGIPSKHMPLDAFDPEDIDHDPSEPIYFICRSGRRSYEAASQAVAHGFEQVFNVEGGILAWESEDHPVHSGPVSS